ncbi:hypothetical protein MUP77_13735 [Candidatus Bathyarchaeota archaeon]|nr:hypothetical protein [Candidatus Bathyarchaeota archaeon]
MYQNKINKKCPICGKDFETHSKQVIYCSIPCRREGLKRKSAVRVKKYYDTTMGKVV